MINKRNALFFINKDDLSEHQVQQTKSSDLGINEVAKPTVKQPDYIQILNWPIKRIKKIYQQ
jgi:hypothetical protein